jgi:hypothetical protein
MNHRQWLGLTLMTGLLLCLLAVPGVLAQTIPSHLSQPPPTHNSAEQQSASSPSSPPGDSLLVPENPTIHPILNTQPQLYFPIVMANNGLMFEVGSVRQLTACENQGRHHIFTRIVDSDGDGLSDIPIQVCWAPGTDNCAVITTDDAGWAVFAMFKGIYSVQVASGNSQVASGITADFGIDEVCEETGEIGNYRFHYSYEVIFIKTG